MQRAAIPLNSASSFFRRSTSSLPKKLCVNFTFTNRDTSVASLKFGTSFEIRMSFNRNCPRQAARWQDVNFDKGELRISRRVDAYGEEGAPKSTAGVRTVPLSAQLLSALKAWKVKSKFSKPADLIFPNRHGSQSVSPGTAYGILRCPLGSRQDLRRRRCKRLRDKPHYRSRWTATATCFLATITGGRWTRLRRDCSRTSSEPIPGPCVTSCAIHVPAQTDTRREGLDLVGIWQHQQT